MALAMLLVVFNVCLVFTLMDSTVLSKSDSAVQLFVTPNAGYSTENIEVQCQLTPSSIISPLSSSKFDNIYLSVKTDSVRPSGILLQFDDSTDRCQVIPEKKFHIEICNATLIRIHISHTVINETLQTIDYVCSKGTIYVSSSYRILQDRSARFYDSTSNTSSMTSSSLLFIIFLIRSFSNITL